MRTPEQYLASLRDGRRVIYRGEVVPDVTSHPPFSRSRRHLTVHFRVAEDPAYRPVAIVDDSDSGVPISRYFHILRTPNDLRDRSHLITESTRAAWSFVPLIKEIGTDALFALLIVTGEMDRQINTAFLPRVQAFYRRCRDRPPPMAVAPTHAKGDRGKRPREQSHPDPYLPMVERRRDGLVGRG